MRFAKRLTRQMRGVLTRSLEELRDAWAIALAEVAAVLAYALGRSEIEAASVAGAVLAVRVGAGVILPMPPGPKPEPPSISMRVLQVRSHIDKGLTDQEIARRMKVSERYVARIRRQYVRPTDTPEIPATPRPFWDHPFVKGTLTAGGFLSLGYTLYRIIGEIFGPR